MNRQIRNSLLLVLTALIWGVAFVAQSEGGGEIGSFSFNAIRSFVGALSLIPVIMFLDSKGMSDRRPKASKDIFRLIKAGSVSGIFLFLGTSLQQVSLTLGISVGKAGFLTTIYILIVPIIGLFFKKKCGINIWIGVFLALIGLYLLCVKNEGFHIEFLDGLVILCAFAFSVQIMIVDHYSPEVDPVRFSLVQFVMCGILSSIPMLFTEIGFGQDALSVWAEPLANGSTWIPILYAGVMSCGVAYTLQVVAQSDLNPTIASLCMSLESVFSVLAGLILLGQSLSGRELAGCGIIFVSVVLSQLPEELFTRRRR